MRTLDRSEASSSIHSNPKRKKRIFFGSGSSAGGGVDSIGSLGGSFTSDTVMEYPDGSGKEGQNYPRQQPISQHSAQQQQQQRSYLSHQQQQIPPESRQPQHRLYPQQQPPPLQQQPPPNLFGQPSVYPRGHPYAQQDINMVAAAAAHNSLDREYLHQQQAQYLQQQQQPQHVGPYGAPAGYPSPVARQYVVQQQQQQYQQQLAMQQQYGNMYPGPPHMDPAAAAVVMAAGYGGRPPPHLMPQAAPPQQPYLQPQRVGRLPADRPLIKLSVSLIDTYKHINTIYYEERDARRAARAKEKAKKASSSSASAQGNATSGPVPGAAAGQGTNNNGWDDENYDYIVTPDELFFGRYKIKERIGKGSFGQVVCAEDTHENCDVAIKIIKSKKPFLMQAKTEIELLSHLNEKDREDQNNVVRLITHFMYRNHQCLVFEMLSLNLYELLKNTQFGGVSLNLIRKFARQVLKSLSFLARKDVDIIHCDLKPENILLRHPKKSGIKVIDFGSSCRSNKRMYSYIQSRFYRSPEVMLGLPYTVAIDMWSLGCILAEMHTGEPLFSGSDQFDQMQKIVKILGMIPFSMLDKANDQHRLQFFERVRRGSGRDEWAIKQMNTSASSSRGGGASTTSSKGDSSNAVVVPSTDPIATLSEVIRAETSRKKKYPQNETGNSALNYDLFVDLIHQMLAYDPRHRITPEDALNHPFITEQHKE